MRNEDVFFGANVNQRFHFTCTQFGDYVKLFVNNYTLCVICKNDHFMEVAGDVIGRCQVE